jgi:hypothetical protein
MKATAKINTIKHLPPETKCYISHCCKLIIIDIKKLFSLQDVEIFSSNIAATFEVRHPYSEHPTLSAELNMNGKQKAQLHTGIYKPESIKVRLKGYGYFSVFNVVIGYR